jgi:hypothetical protein
MLFLEKLGVKKKYECVKLIEKNLGSAGYIIGFEKREDAIRKVRSGKVLVVIFTPRITKKEVVTTAFSGEVFIHKSTRHVIPARPLFLNIPLKWLNMNLKEANKILDEYLFEKKIRYLPPGQTFDRLYEEEIYIFE